MTATAGHTNAAPVAWTRAGRLGVLALLGAVVVALAVATIGSGAGYIPGNEALGYDYVSYRDAALRVVGGGNFYEAKQLAGPWTFETYREPLYPPSSLLLFVPFAVLPWVLWWAVPAAVIAWCIRYHRPNPLGLGLIVVALLSRTSVYAWWVGNPGIWLAAAVAAATMWGTGPLVLFKPSFFPLALIGFARRGWWVAAAVVGVACLLAIPLWADYVTVLRNAPGVGYSIINDAPLVAVPLLAWLSRGAVGRSPATAR